MRNFGNQAHKNILDIWKCKIFFEFSNKRFQWLGIFVQIKDEHYFLEILRRHLADILMRAGSADILRSIPSKETSQVLYFFSTTLHSSKMISIQGYPDRSRTISSKIGWHPKSPDLCKHVQDQENDRIQRIGQVLEQSVSFQLDKCSRQIFEAPQMEKIQIQQC